MLFFSVAKKYAVSKGIDIFVVVVDVDVVDVVIVVVIVVFVVYVGDQNFVSGYAIFEDVSMEDKENMVSE